MSYLDGVLPQHELPCCRQLTSIYSRLQARQYRAPANAAGTFLWMLAADTYADYDGFTIYTTKRASKAPQPKWPELNAEHMLQVRFGDDQALLLLQCNCHPVHQP